jgi:outer membrane protease
MPIGIASFDLLYTNDINILFDIDPLVLTLQNMENDEHYGRVRTFRSYVKHIKMLGR